MNLPTMTEFVLKENSKDYLELDETGFTNKKIKIYLEALLLIDKYAQFLQSTTQLSDFVPCKDGVPLEKPEKPKECNCKGIEHYCHDDKKWAKSQMANCKNCEICLWGERSNQFEEYQEALDNCKFKGFEIVEGETKYHLKKPNEGSKSLLAYVNKDKPKAFELLNEILGNKTIEDLIAAGIDLEPTERISKELKLT